MTPRTPCSFNKESQDEIGSHQGTRCSELRNARRLFIGHVAQNRFFEKPQPAQQVIVRLTSGVLIAITQPVNPVLSRGMRVYVEGQGHEARVVPA